MLPSSENDTVSTGRLILSKLVNFQIHACMLQEKIYTCVQCLVLYIYKHFFHY